MWPIMNAAAPARPTVWRRVARPARRSWHHRRTEKAAGARPKGRRGRALAGRAAARTWRAYRAHAIPCALALCGQTQLAHTKSKDKAAKAKAAKGKEQSPPPLWSLYEISLDKFHMI